MLSIIKPHQHSQGEEAQTRTTVLVPEGSPGSEKALRSSPAEPIDYEYQNLVVRDDLSTMKGLPNYTHCSQGGRKASCFLHSEP
jgi:hypothetical protein